jgi:hypothetical protein
LAKRVTGSITHTIIQKAPQRHVQYWLLVTVLTGEENAKAMPESFFNCDSVGTWLPDCCQRSPGSETELSVLYANYHAWCLEHDFWPESEKIVRDRLSEEDFVGKYSHFGRCR